LSVIPRYEAKKTALIYNFHKWQAADVGNDQLYRAKIAHLYKMGGPTVGGGTQTCAKFLQVLNLNRHPFYSKTLLLFADKFLHSSLLDSFIMLQSPLSNSSKQLISNDVLLAFAVPLKRKHILQSLTNNCVYLQNV
jgi:hypothetical protein